MKSLITSGLKRKLLAYFLANSRKPIYLRDLARTLDVDASNLSRELRLFTAMGLLSVQERGKYKYFKVNRSASIYKNLKNLLGEFF